MRHQDIKRRIVREAIMIVSAAALLSGTAYILTGLRDDYANEKNTLQTDVSTITKDREVLFSKFDRITKNIDEYQDVMDRFASGQFFIGREPLQRKIDAFRTRYFLNDMALTMSDIQPANDSRYQYKVGKLVSSNLTANFDALADDHIFSLLNDMQQELPGGLKITKFYISRENKLTNEALRTIVREGRFTMVKGTAQFTWYGMETPETPKEPSSDQEQTTP